jgi:hypothetical protein
MAAMATDRDWEWVKGLSAPARRALANAGYSQLTELTKVGEKSLAALHGMGGKAIEALRRELAEKGLTFGD